MPDSLLLDWIPTEFGGFEAILSDFAAGDGVRFSIQHCPTCYRRGPWKLLIEIAHGPKHIAWGCFDDQDQPMRWYQLESSWRMEAEALAIVLLTDRLRYESSVLEGASG